MSDIRYRYPGTRPFTEQDRNLFFGRDNDIASLSQMIRLEQLIVLFGKSGLGKTSLLNAGVMPLLRETGKFFPVEVRFGYAQEWTTGEIFWNKLAQNCDFETGFWQKFKENFPHLTDHNSPEAYWLLAKCLYQNTGGKTLVLVFDQFEELFTFPDNQVNGFAEILDTLLFGEIPQKVQDAVYERLERDSEFFTPEELEMLFDSIKVKIVISVRSDKMSLLNRLKNKIPHILQKTYELKPLTLDAAREALTRPPQMDGEFISPKFVYTPEAEQNILDYLSDSRQKQIEAFQLQLVCQYCENIIIKKAAAKAPLRVEVQDLGDLSTIFTRHYDNIINEITDPQEHLAVRRLIEENMIIDGNRVPLPDKVILHKHKISPETLKKLVDSRLLRSEPNTVGGFSYEISHDTLVEPILKSYEVRRVREEEEERERQRQAELERLREQRRRQRTIITIVSVAAVISLAFAVFGIFMWQRAVLEQAKGKAKDATSYRDIEKYQAAIGKYQEMFGIYKSYFGPGKQTKIKNVEKEIEQCKELDSISGLFYGYMDKAMTLIENKDFDSVKTAVELYQKAKALDYEFAQKTFEKFMPKLKLAMDKLLQQAEYGIDAGGIGKELARRNLTLLNQIIPDDPRVKKLNKQLKE